jgi:glycosyltransferase involved in cell wall biosynthesis
MNEVLGNATIEPVASPAFSVVMPLWNKEATVGRAIRSVLAQTIQDWELIVVDDGSTDGSAAEVGRFDDPRIRLVRQANAGVSAARNRGVQEARGDWVAFLDADDEWLPGFLAHIAALRDRFPECAVCATRYFYGFPGKGVRAERIRGMDPSGPVQVLEDYFAVAAASAPPLCSSAVAVKRAALLSIGGFPVGVIAGEDLLTWARLAAREAIAYDPEPLAIFWQPRRRGERPRRLPDAEDFVGRALAELEARVDPPRKDSLRRYRAHWHTMRASVYLQYGMPRESRAEIHKARVLGGWSPKLAGMGLLGCLPGLAGRNAAAWRARWAAARKAD